MWKNKGDSGSVQDVGRNLVYRTQGSQNFQNLKFPKSQNLENVKNLKNRILEKIGKSKKIDRKKNRSEIFFDRENFSILKKKSIEKIFDLIFFLTDFTFLRFLRFSRFSNFLSFLRFFWPPKKMFFHNFDKFFEIEEKITMTHLAAQVCQHRFLLISVEKKGKITNSYFWSP